MANSDMIVSGVFRTVDEANSAKQELINAGFGSDSIGLDQASTGRAGVDVHELDVRAGSRRQEVENILRRLGAGELKLTVSMPVQEQVRAHVPEADRWEQDLPATGDAGSGELGSPRIDAPEADTQEQQLPAERVPVSSEGSISINPERGSEADQMDQVMPADAFGDEDEERR